MRIVGPGKNNNQLLKQLYNESALSLLEKLLQSTPYGDTLMIFVFHLSHLLLRLLLFPDSEQSCKVFDKLFTYQTSKLLEKCAQLMPFDNWLCYIEMIGLSAPEQAICLLDLIDRKLDMSNREHFKQAEKAVN